MIAVNIKVCDKLVAGDLRGEKGTCQDDIKQNANVGAKRGGINRYTVKKFSLKIGSPSRMYEVVTIAAEKAPIPGNVDGSYYLTM